MSVLANMIRVLIVNDQEDIARLWMRLVNTTTGMQCVGYARDGEEAIMMARQLQPHVTMMDIMMPGIDGLEATRVIKDLMPETTIVAYSAYIGMNEKAFEAGADEFILMPVAPNKLLETIRRMYSQAQTRDVLS